MYIEQNEKKMQYNTWQMEFELPKKKKKKIYLPKRLVARKGFSASTLVTIHTIKQK